MGERRMAEGRSDVWTKLGGGREKIFLVWREK